MRWSGFELTLMAAGLLAIAGCGSGTSEPAPGSAIVTEDPSGPLATALAEARETERNVLVVYGRDTCPYSRQFEKETLGDAEVKRALDDLVVLRLEQGKNAGEFEKAWGKQPTPSVVTISAEGRTIGTMLNGTVEKSAFLDYAAWAKTGQGPQPGIATGGG